MADAESRSSEGLFAFYEKSRPAFSMKSVQFRFAGTNMISKIALNQLMSHMVSVLYAATLKSVPFTYILDGKNGPILAFTSFCKSFISSLFGKISEHYRLESVGINLMGTIICVGGAVFVTLYLRAKPPQHLALQNSWRAIALIMLVLMMNTVAATFDGKRKDW